MDKIALHDQICAQLNTLYARKNNDYGDSFGKSYAEYGMTMPCIRLEDKLNRLKSLTVRNVRQNVQNESVADTLMDLANYAVMTLVELKLAEHEETMGTEGKQTLTYPSGKRNGGDDSK